MIHRNKSVNMIKMWPNYIQHVSNEYVVYKCIRLLNLAEE